MIVVNEKKILSFNNKKYKCSIGKNGLTKHKYEGDKKTPIGIFSLGNLYVRTDKIKNIKSKFNIISINTDMAWSDDPKSKNYNTLIKTSNEHNEKLYRNDNLYDIILVIKYNMSPVIPNKGSAIFIHNTSEKYQPTNGCIALKIEDLIEILLELKPTDKITILNNN